MERKNPFAPEPKTVPSVRNPMLENVARRVATLEVSEAPRTETSALERPSSVPTVMPPSPEAIILELDAATPRPRMSASATPRVVADPVMIRLLPLGPRDGFLLAHIDGASDLRTLVDVTAMTELEVTLIVERLIELGVVEV